MKDPLNIPKPNIIPKSMQGGQPKMVAINTAGKKMNVNTGATTVAEDMSPKKYSKYEVQPNQIFCIKFALKEEDGRMIVVDYGKGEDHWVKFKMWTYPQELEWRNQTSNFDNIHKTLVLDENKFNEIKLRNLIEEWSFSEYDDSLKLLHVNNYLSDEGFKLFMGMFPSVIRHIFSSMNYVLQFNG